MNNVEVVVEYNLWNKKIKKPNLYLKKKIKKLNNLFPSRKYFSFTILLTNNKKMKLLNKKFRKKNKTTDVLSFPFWNAKQLKNIKKKNVYLGDLAINYNIVSNRSRKTSFDLEFDKMWIHGYLHLLGYSHSKMKKIENKILNLCY